MRSLLTCLPTSFFDLIRPVNPVPRTYVRGFGALPLQGGRNIHPVPTVLDRGRIVLSRRSWNGVHPPAYARGVLWYGVKPVIVRIGEKSGL